MVLEFLCRQIFLSILACFWTEMLITIIFSWLKRVLMCRQSGLLKRWQHIGTKPVLLRFSMSIISLPMYILICRQPDSDSEANSLWVTIRSILGQEQHLDTTNGSPIILMRIKANLTVKTVVLQPGLHS